jgi:GlpG protein
MFEVVRASLDKDLSEFTEQLWALKITHRVVFESEQVLWIENPSQLEIVHQMYQHWDAYGSFPDLSSSLLQQSQAAAQTISRRRSVIGKVNIAKIPTVLVLLVTSAVLSWLTGFGSQLDSLRAFTITDFQSLGNQVNYYSLEHNFSTLELWRFISPVFIHFNFAHIIFNALWVWVIGSVIEQRHSSYTMVFISLVAGISSNIAQYYVSGPIFGGLSGVVYAIISYAWAWDKCNCVKLGVVNNGLMGFMLAWLVLGYSGLLTQMGLGAIANTAHLVGLISGLLSMLCVKYYTKLFNISSI